MLRINEIASGKREVGVFIVPVLIYANERIQSNDFYALPSQGFICLRHY